MSAAYFWGQNDDGFTILETLVTFLILSMVLTGTIQLIATSSQMIKRSTASEDQVALLTQIELEVLPDALARAAVAGKKVTVSKANWHIEIEPVDAGSSEQFADPRDVAQLFHTRVEITHPLRKREGAPISTSFQTFRLIGRGKPDQ